MAGHADAAAVDGVERIFLAQPPHLFPRKAGIGEQAVLADDEAEVEICALANDAKRSFSTTSTLRITRPRRSLIGAAQLGLGRSLSGNATVRFGSKAASGIAAVLYLSKNER